MHKIHLGTTVDEVSTVALGTWTFAGDAIWGPSAENEAISVIHAAIDSGINLFDTAPNYGDGRSETVLGKALGDRPDVMVATKFKIDGVSATELRSMVQASLKRLQRDRIDLMQVHWPAATADETQQALHSLQQMRTEGLIGHIGVCNFGVFDLAESTDSVLVSNQVPYSLLWRVIEGENGIGATSRRHGLTTIAYSPIQQGLLSGRYRDLREFPEGRRRTRLFSGSNPLARHEGPGFEAETQTVLENLHAVATRFGRDLLDLALGFVAAQPFIDVVLVGARDRSQLQRTIEAIDSPITQEEIDAVSIASEELRLAIGGNPDMYLENSRVRYPDSNGEPSRIG